MIYRRNLGAFTTAINQYDEEFDQVLFGEKAKENMATQILKLAKERNIPMQKDVNLMAELIDMDLGYSVTPQLYSLISEILFMLKEIEKNT